MVPVVIAGNILGEATTPSGNIFIEAMRGIVMPFSPCRPPITAFYVKGSSLDKTVGRNSATVG